MKNTFATGHALGAFLLAAAACGTSGGGGPGGTNGDSSGSSASTGGSTSGGSGAGGGGAATSGNTGSGQGGGGAGGGGTGVGGSGNPSGTDSGTGPSSGSPAPGGDGGAVVSPPLAPYAEHSLDPGWQFIKQDVTGAEALAFNDSAWSTVSTPHTYNDVDSYGQLINHSSGDVGSYTGPAWYRKHFTIPTKYSGGKVIIEFERIRQGARFYMNGSPVGVYDDGITACGIDVTGKVMFGTADNVLAVRVDNDPNYLETATGVGFEWAGKAFNPDYGGLVGHVWLHLPGKIYQTYPLYNGLQTTGIYVYPSSFANVTPSKGDLTVNVESQVKNESGTAQTVTLGVNVVDPATGATVASLQGAPTPLPDATPVVLKATGALTGANLWSDLTPNLYNVVTTLTVGGSVVDTRTTVTGFRQTAFKGGAGVGGVYVNGRFVYLLGYAQRASNDWAALGEAVPDWMHDFHASLIRGSNSNYIRWMHITPQRVDVASNDKYGVINIAPAGDKEADVTGVQWTQRTNVMRASMIYLRNNPSLLFWEAGNNGIVAAHMQEMQALKKQWDPSGGRAIGCRDLADAAAAPFAEYFGTMVAYSTTWSPTSDAAYFRGYSNNYRNQAPVIEAEDERDEAARRYWDDFSPPHFGFKPGPADTYHWNQETFITGDTTAPAAINRLNIWKNTFSITNTDSMHSRYAGYASIYFSDSNADGRQDSSEVCRVSGKVDAVRLPKEIYYAHKVVGSTTPDIHIIGHWTYPAATKKTMYVVSNTLSVELFVNGTSIGKSSTPTDHYLFAFPNVVWAAGTIKAVGYDATGKSVAEHQLQTAGAPAKIKLTPKVDPNGGLKANGADVAMFDFEVLDANGLRCPTYEDTITFTMTGPAIWRGGYNSGVVGSTNKMTLLTEAGVNRVFVRSTLMPGTITVTATGKAGLTPDTATVTSKAMPIVGGML